MTSIIITFCTVYFLLIQIILMNVTGSELAVSDDQIINNATTWKSDRTKRSLYDSMPSSLRIAFEYPTGELVNLDWKKTVRVYIANKNLPVVNPDGDSYPEVMTRVGDFVTYQDVKKCSAVVYFENLNALYGVIGIDYYIYELPFDFDEFGKYRLDVIGEPFIKSYEPLDHVDPCIVVPPPSDIDTWSAFFTLPSNNSNEDSKRPTEHEAGTSRQRPITSQQQEIESALIDVYGIRDQIKFEYFYSETGVFITRDITEIFKNYYGDDQYILFIVRYYLVYFNAVDMMFRTFLNPYFEFHINIAKLIIENEVVPFKFLNGTEIHFPALIATIPKYLTRRLFQKDSVDHIFIHTSYPIWDAPVQVNGISKHGADLYEAKKEGRFYNAIPITVANFKKASANYAIAVHEIGRILNLKMSNYTRGLSPIGQCYNIMQIDGPKCHKCLVWKKENYIQFFKFFSQNRNRCILMNEPRSLYPPGPYKSLVSPRRQCQCYGYAGYLTSDTNNIQYNKVRASECKLPLKCITRTGNHSSIAHAVLPIDGTRCSSNFKVCWNELCVSL